MYDGREYVVLSDRSSAPPLARQVLQLLMDQSGGSLPLMELCSRYKTTFGIEPNITKIKEELLDYVQVKYRFVFCFKRKKNFNVPIVYMPIREIWRRRSYIAFLLDQMTYMFNTTL